MTSPAHIYLSFDAADARSAADLKRQLALAFQPRATVFWSRENLPTETFRAKAAEFLEKSDLFVAVLSLHYENTPDVRWEAAKAIEVQQSRPALQILSLLARSTAVPSALQAFQSALPPDETIENEAIARDRQLLRAAKVAVQVVSAAPRSNDIGNREVDLPVEMYNLRERLLAQTDRVNHTPLLALLKRLLYDINLKRDLLDIDDSFRKLREKIRLSQISVDDLKRQSMPIRKDLEKLIKVFREDDLVSNWKEIFLREYYHFTSSNREDSHLPPYFAPVDEIIIPDTSNSNQGSSGNLLSSEQQNEFRLNLLLAKDAMAVKNYAKAYEYCDYVRTKIDPQSAQLYEYLLITFLQKETAFRAMQQSVDGNDRLLQHILLFSGRMRQYQNKSVCPTSTAQYNLTIVSEVISDSALKLYYEYKTDPVLDTGKHGELVDDSRHALRVILGNTMKVCRLVHPSEELLEAAVIECCGGGKCNWLEKVNVINNLFEFIPNGHFDLLGIIRFLIRLLDLIEASYENKIVKSKDLLREDVYLSLLSKRQLLANQIKEDQKRLRPFTDVRESVVRFTYSCILSSEIFGDLDKRNKNNSFYRLALDYLLPSLLISPTQTGISNLTWFTLNEQGDVVAHPDCAAYHFDVQAIVEKIIRDRSGKAGWLKVHTNIKEAVYLQFVADTQKMWEEVKTGLSFTDFRRMESLDARRTLINCLQRWYIAYRAYPEKSGQDFLDRCIREISGEGLLVWLQFDGKGQLETVPDSLALGYDAQTILRALVSESTRYTEEDLRRSISEYVFQKQILPDFERIKKADESQRIACAKLLRGALWAYKLHQDSRFLDLVWRELTEEIKFRWVDISFEGREKLFQVIPGFDALQVLGELHQAIPSRFRFLELRERIAARRLQDTEARYFREISEFRHENRLPERQVGIDIIRKVKGIYLYLPHAEFLKLALDELQGRGRVRWHANFLGFFPLQENHYENSYFNFEYKFERYEIKRLMDNQFGEMQRVLREIGEL